jgi:hypothetical protein
VVYHPAVKRLSLAVLLCALAACARAPLRAADGAAAAVQDPAAVLARMVSALEEGRWDDAYALLSARWRSRATPARLQADWRASGPVGPEAAARVAALLRGGASLQVGTREAVLRVGEGRRARLVREDGAWRVDALE